MELLFPQANKVVTIQNIVFDYNGTLAVDGKVSKEVYDKVISLAKKKSVYIVTADTFGSVQETFKDTDINTTIISNSLEKANFIKTIGPEKTIAIGNGANDAEMLSLSTIGIAFLGKEGLATSALVNSDFIVKNHQELFEILDEPNKMIATLRK